MSLSSRPGEEANVLQAYVEPGLLTQDHVDKAGVVEVHHAEAGKEGVAGAEDGDHVDVRGQAFEAEHMVGGDILDFPLPGELRADNPGL